MAPLPVVPPNALLADVFGADGVGAERAAIVDGDRFVGVVESFDAGRLLASGGVDVTCADAARPPPVHGDLGWTVGDAREVLDDGSLATLAVLDGGRFLGVVTAASILALDRRLR